MGSTKTYSLGVCALAAVIAFVAGSLITGGLESKTLASPSVQLINVTTSMATACTGPQPANYVGENDLNVNFGRPPVGVRFGVIYVPSYDPAGVITSQWPEPCGESYGTHYRQYLFVSNGPVLSSHQVLPIAVGPPTSSECVEKTYPTEDGNTYPLLCRGGHVNVAAWVFYAELRNSVMRLGKNANRCQVALTVEGSHSNTQVPAEESFNLPEIDSSYQLAHAYYGWTFSVPDLAASPPAWLSTCGKKAVQNWPG